MPNLAVTPSTMPELLAAAAARGQGGWFFHSGHDVTALPVKDLYDRALRTGTDLARSGVAIGTNVGLVGQNCPEWAEWAWAIWQAGATLVPLPAPVVVGGSFGEQVGSLATATGCAVVVGEGALPRPADGRALRPLGLVCASTALGPPLRGENVLGAGRHL